MNRAAMAAVEKQVPTAGSVPIAVDDGSVRHLGYLSPGGIVADDCDRE